MRAYSLSRWHPEPEPVEDPARLLRPGEAARYLAMSLNALYRHRHEVNGPVFVRCRPRTVRYRRVDLDAWIEQRLQQGQLPSRRAYRMKEAATTA